MRKHTLPALLLLSLLLASCGGQSIPSFDIQRDAGVDTEDSGSDPVDVPEGEDTEPGVDVPVGPCPHNTECGPAEAVVERAVDGDTIVLTTGERIRYIGVDTPEISGDDAPEPWGPEAAAFNEALVEGQTVYLDYEGRCIDATGNRVLAYVYTGAPWDEGGTLVNAELIRAGMSLYYPWDEDDPPCRQDELIAAEGEAAAAGVGLWKTCHLPQPEGATVVPASAENVSITEVFANPEGSTEKGYEWFELYVDLPPTQWVDLTDVRFNDDVTSATGGDLFAAERGCLLLQGGSYYVVAGPSLVTAPVDVASDEPAEACWTFAGQCVAHLADDLSLGNTDGAMALWKGSQLLATAPYGDTEQGASNQLAADGSWCVSTRPYDEDWTRFGSPGLANPSCGAAFCEADGAIVEAVQPVAGELILTEILSDVPGSDTDATNVLQEWFEAYLLPGTSGPRHLVGVTVHKEADASDAGKGLLAEARACLPVAPGDWILFGMTADTSLNGGLDVDVVLDGALKLNGDNGHLELRRADGAVIDAVTDYGPTDEGVAVQLGADIIADDEPWNLNDSFETAGGAPVWCDAPEGGTPGEANPIGCQGCFCRRAEGWIEATPPELGELFITEIFGNTPGTEQTTHEWVEVESAVDEVRYLNCVALNAKDDAGGLLGAGRVDCLPISALLGPVVLCNDAAGAAETGITDCVAYDTSALTNSGYVTLSTADGELDRVDYEDLSDGVSTMWSGDGSAWCDTPASEVYFTDTSEGDDYVGTPGAANPDCP